MSAEDHQEGTVKLLPVATVKSFPVGTFIENIAVRHSGPLLVTVHNKNELLQIDPLSESAPSLVNLFHTGVCGIVEVEDDIFYVSGGTIGVQGSWAIFRVDVSTFSADVSGKVKTPAQITKHVDIPEALFLNGSALLDRHKGIILLADSILGLVYSVDVKTKTVKTWLKDAALGKVTDNPMIPGVNGIKVNKGYLYLSNTDAKKFYRASITGSGESSGSVELEQDHLNVDDFVFDAEGSAYLTTHVFQSVVKLDKNGVRTRIAGGPDDTIVAGTTAAAFGRTPKDKTILYVTTTGGMSYPVNGQIGDGRVLKIDVGYPAANA